MVRPFRFVPVKAQACVWPGFRVCIHV